MKTAPIVPARIAFDGPGPDAPPSAPDFGDVYHARAGAFAQARHVFLGGNRLPERWRGRARFVILETGFGLGNNFLATWAAWREDAQRSERLFFVSIEKHPPTRTDLARAHAASPEPALAAQLVEAWPALTPNLHRLVFEAGRVQLLLALGDVRDWLAELVAAVDAFYLDGFAPAKNPDMWDAYTLKRLARLAAPGATAATWSVARGVRDGLTAAGFEVQRVPGFASKGQMCVAEYRPRHETERPAGRMALAPQAREVLIVGAGLAGAACAHALREQGIACRVLEARPGPAQAGSGNPGGLFHGTLNPDDGLHARFNRAAALATERLLKTIGPDLPWLQRGLLRLETRYGLDEMQALLARLGLPADYVQALDASEAAASCGLPLQQPAWFYPGGGALPPQAYVRALLGDTPLLSGHAVAALRQDGHAWSVLDAEGRTIASADALVLATGHETPALLASLRTAIPSWPLQAQRGQISNIPAGLGWPVPALPVAGAGYAIADGQGGLWCGATAQDGDLDVTLRDGDHAANLAQYRALAGVDAVIGDAPLAGRVGWRLLAPDRLPLVGGLPMSEHQGRQDQVRLWPELPGLAVCTGLASRGIGWAALCGQALASRLSGAPVPLEAGLLDAIAPARFALAQRRR